MRPGTAKADALGRRRRPRRRRHLQPRRLPASAPGRHPERRARDRRAPRLLLRAPTHDAAARHTGRRGRPPRGRAARRAAPVLPGAVRASIGIGTTPHDIDRLIEALHQIAATGPRSRYEHLADLDEYLPRGTGADMAALFLGLDTAPIADAIEATPLADFEGTSMEEALTKAFGTFAERARYEIPDLRDAIADTKPTRCSSTSRRSAPPRSPTLSGCRGRSRSTLFQSFTPGPGAPPVFGLVPFCLAPEPGLEVLDGPMRDVGLPPLTSPEEVWRASLYLYYTAPPLEHPDLGFPPSFRFVGPGLWEPQAPTPSWLDELPEPLVIVSIFQRVPARPRPRRDRAARPRRGACRGRRPYRRPRSRGVHDSGQRTPRALAATRRAAGPRGVCRLPRRHGHHTEDARRRRAALHRPVRARPVRGRCARRSPQSRRHSCRPTRSAQTRCEAP